MSAMCQVLASSTDIFVFLFSVFLFLVMDLQMRNLSVEDQSDFHAAEKSPLSVRHSHEHQETHQGNEGGAPLIGKDECLEVVFFSLCERRRGPVYSFEFALFG